MLTEPPLLLQGQCQQQFQPSHLVLPMSKFSALKIRHWWRDWDWWVCASAPLLSQKGQFGALQELQLWSVE